MNISVERLRVLARRKSASYGAMMGAWRSVVEARKELSAAEAAKDHHVSYRGPKRDLETDKPFEAAIAAAKDRLERCEAEHDRLDSEWESTSNLARRGYAYAREHITQLPADIQEAFQ